MTADSPVPVDEVTARSASFDALTCTVEGLHWIEAGAALETPAVLTWSPGREPTVRGTAVGSSLHAYGGGSYAVDGKDLWYVSESDGQLWNASTAHPLTRDHRTLGDLFATGSDVLCIGENPTHDDLLLVDPATGATEVLHSAPFLSSPRLHGRQLAWIQWPTDVMPWDTSELWRAELQSGCISNPRMVAGGPGVSVTEPRWAPNGSLHFLSDETGWWNLYRWTTGTVDGNSPHAVAPMAADCAAAPWEHGYSSYTFLPGGAVALIAQNGPRHRLLTISANGEIKQVPSPFTSIKPYLATCGNTVALIGSSPTAPQQIALLHPDGVPLQVVRSAADQPDASTISIPEELTILSEGMPVSVWYYPPPTATPKATIVRVHPGPTHQADLRLDWETQYFTSRGYAIADVDYRGSTGYGRAFRKALDGRWGVADVQDCVAAAQHLIYIGKAERDTLIIYGASAGGYTALRAVCDVATPFALAVARSPIVDPMRWQQTAPRFQRPHAAALTGSGAQIAAETVCRPVAIVHGTKDPVAPINDARALIATLQARGAQAQLLELPGEGHFPSGGELGQALTFELAAFDAIGRSAA